MDVFLSHGHRIDKRLDDVCDNLHNHAGILSTVRGAKPPSRNGLSNANREREAAMGEELFWTVLGHLQTTSPGFRDGPKKRKRGLPRRFVRAIHAIDSSTIKLVANTMAWAKHRHRKAAAKLHLRLDLRSFLPGFAIVGPARDGDNSRAREVCAGVLEGEIAIFDKAYIDFGHLHDLGLRGGYWVTRAKDNMSCRVKRRLIKRPVGNILRDDVIVLKNKKSKAAHPAEMRRVRARVEIDGKEVEMEFITNNLE